MKREVKLEGTVVQAKADAGSKSEHAALQFETDRGSFLLRMQGGNPFNEPSLQQYEGHRVAATGIINEYTFLARDVKKISRRK